MKSSWILKTALEYTDDYADVYNLIGMEYLFMDNLEMAKQSFIKWKKTLMINLHYIMWSIVLNF
jgi:hypothetical protein